MIDTAEGQGTPKRVRADAQRSLEALLASAKAVFAISGVDAPVREIAEPGDLPPLAALAAWLQRYALFIAAKRGLAKALHSGDPAFDALPGHFDARLRPALRGLLDAATSAGEVRDDVEADELLSAVASLCMSAHDAVPGRAARMVALLVDGLRYRAAG